MRLHPEELELARKFTRVTPFEELTEQQLRLILTRGRELYLWFKGHPKTHTVISLAVLTFLFSADYWTWIHLPRMWLDPEQPNSFRVTLLAGLIVGSVHSWLMYSLGVYSFHEGAAHRVVFVGKGRLARFGGFIAANLCRISGGEPQDYAKNHILHHTNFGGEKDGEFLNFVAPRRYWLTFIPMAAFLNISDFMIHRPLDFTRSRAVTAAVAAIYHGLYGYFAYQLFGATFAGMVVFCFPHMGFWVDRLRQFTEHNLMPLENNSGSRSLGLGFWGLLLGGGPWGSPCHWEHHLVSSIPWYQQLVLHRYVSRLLTLQQRKQFLIEPFIGFPKLWCRLIRDTSAFERRPDSPVTGL